MTREVKFATNIFPVWSLKKGTFKFSEFQALHNPQSYKKVKPIPRITAARLMGGLLCQKIELVTGLLGCRWNALSDLSKMIA